MVIRRVAQEGVVILQTDLLSTRVKAEIYGESSLRETLRVHLLLVVLGNFVPVDHAVEYYMRHEV